MASECNRVKAELYKIDLDIWAIQVRENPNLVAK